MEDNYIIEGEFKPNRCQPNGYDKQGNFIGFKSREELELEAKQFRLNAMKKIKSERKKNQYNVKTKYIQLEGSLHASKNKKSYKTNEDFLADLK